MVDPRRYLALHTVEMLRELGRRWWQLDLYFTDSAGRPVEFPHEADGGTGCDFCRGVWLSPQGRLRCQRSVHEAYLRHRASQRDRATRLHTCHLGLTLATQPMFCGSRFAGIFFACGFVRRPPGRALLHRLRGALRETLPEGRALAGERVPVISNTDLERLRDLLSYGAQEMGAFEEERAPRPPPTSVASGGFGEVIARAPAMVKALRRLRALAASSEPVTLCGEPGTGRRTLARALHLSGPRRERPFIVFESSPDSPAGELLLFGQGAETVRKGLLEDASEGTLYLAPGSWLPLPIQLKLTRFLQEGTFVRLGEARARRCDVRLVFGLEGDLELEAAEGSLRRELADLLRPGLVAIPPLRERPEDLEPLTDRFLLRHAPDGATPPTLSAAVRHALHQYDWPGNARELEDEIRHMLALPSRPGPLSPAALSQKVRQAAGGGLLAGGAGIRGSFNLKIAVRALERDLIQQGLARTHFNKSLLSRQLGISRANLLAKLKRYGLERSRPAGE
ncbi:MAG: sigma 54-interacting transcriptional regulator [Myxococcales bacterium]|nr:sigma 54-interacting transcriptional regulator [Myxococcales bacterium]